MEKLKQLIFEYFIDNPCLSNDIDYQSNKKRKRYYAKMLKNLNEDDLKEIANDYEIKV